MNNSTPIIFSILLIFVVTTSPTTPTSYVNQKLIDALMTESLRNNLVQACENEKITLQCPRNTHIVITNTFYGRLSPSTELCSAPKEYVLSKEDTSCDLPEAEVKIEELCRGKRKCRITVKADFFNRDPCPETSKYLTIAYNCRPISFDDQHFCEGSTMQLSCKPNKRLSIYSATWGRNVNSVPTNCGKLSDKTPVDSDCVLDVLPKVLQECHAKSNCALSVNDYFFGSICKKGIQKSLSIIYMCVNEEVFSDAAIRGQLDSMDYIKKEYEHRLDLKKTNSQESAKDDSDEDDENEEDYIDEDDDVNKLNQKDSEIREDIVFQRDDPQVEPKIFEHNDDQYKQEHIQPYNSEIFEDSSTSAPDAMMVASEFVALWDFIVNNKERCILYFCVSIAVTIIILLLVFICRYSRKSDSPKHEKMLPQRCGNTHHGEMSLLIGGSNGSTPLYFNPSDPEMYSGCSGSGSYPYTDVERIYSSPSYAASIGLKEPDDSRISVPTFMHYDAQITPFHKLAGRYN